jgi:hypothetical protein
MISSAECPRVLSLIPGRVRLHLSGWTGDDRERIENRLRRVNGVEDVQANPLTRNALIRFDRRTTDEKTLLVELQEAWGGLLAAQRPVSAPGSEAPARNDRSQTAEGRGPSASPLIRVGVRGLLGHAAVDSLWFAGGFLGEAIGLPLAGLGPLHVLLDIAVWVIALRSGNVSRQMDTTTERSAGSYEAQEETGRPGSDATVGSR